MALHPDFPSSPHAILDPAVRWFPADESLRETTMDKLMPPLVATLRRKVTEFRDGGYVGATETSRALLHWWFNPDLEGAVLVIHTKKKGEISEAASGKASEELETLRKQANEIDDAAKPVQGNRLGNDAQGGLGRSV